ncbi:WD repeat-containing protein 6 [Anopheles maculipalpis]|uniref:WD repeat-containing protein 6 n=1 Tax=Anopheles maculipalpis TaxID=1496333 RepID=UPI002158DE3B|nr:WD repeat-containing protein 6 [Anopheles maculipalpis]
MRVLTDASCIRVLCSEKLLIAIGNQLLLLYLTSNGRTDRTFAPLPRLVHKIHGIKSCIIESGKYLVIIHAGREAYCMVLDCQTHTFTDSTLIVMPEEWSEQPVPYVRRRLHDWISSISLLSPTQLCIVTCHGVAALLKRDNNNHSQRWDLIDKSPCEDGSTLYCSTITGREWENVVILSGTALGLLLIWSVDGPGSRGKVLKSVSAHNGVIFSIECNFDTGLLNTTSDDRSIKFWNVELSVNKDDCSKTVTLREERYCFAHTARVFQCRIINGAHRTLVASIGEDSHLCLWTTEGNLVLKKRLDEGPTLWNMDYDPESGTIFVTASNGNLHKYCIRHFIENGDNLCKDQTEMMDISPVLSGGEHLAKIKFLPNGCMVAVTNQSQIKLLDNDGTIVQSLVKQEEFKCSLIEAGSTYLYLTGGGCSIKIYDVSEKHCAHLARNATVSFLQEPFKCENGSTDIKEGTIRSLNYCARSKNVAICDASGRCFVLDEKLAIIVSSHRIPQSAERWLTSFLMLNEELLLMADRSGHLYLFAKSYIDPVFKLTNVHGKLGITSFTIEEHPAQNSRDGFYVKTTGHDGRICELFVNTVTRQLELLTFTKSIIGWIDRRMVHNASTFYLGFNDSHFLMADQSNEIHVQFDCGGGHRCWDFYYNQSSETFSYVFIQHKRLKKVQFTMRNNVGSELRLPRFNWHTRSCNVLQVVRRENSYLMFSGGEDNILRINVLNQGELIEEHRKHIFNHISSIKTITIKSQPENDTLLIISAGGRAQICVTSVSLKSFRIKQELEYMLLATDSERTRWKTNRKSTFDPETKFMCAALLSNNDQIVFGCSDGFVRIYQLSFNDDGQVSLSLTKEIFYGRCILKMTTVEVDDSSLFVSMATDGLLCFWDTAHSDEPFYRHRHHSSGVNAVDVRQVDKGKFVFATGGDDQSVAVSLLEIVYHSGKPNIRVLEQLCENYLHTAQVTGLKLLDDNQMISVGVDQRVYVTNFTGYEKLVVERSTNTCIADLKGVSLLRDENELILYGCGVEIIPLQSV